MTCNRPRCGRLHCPFLAPQPFLVVRTRGNRRGECPVHVCRHSTHPVPLAVAFPLTHTIPAPLPVAAHAYPFPVGLPQGLHIDVGLLALDFIRPCWGCADGANAVELQFTAKGPQVRPGRPLVSE